MKKRFIHILLGTLATIGLSFTVVSCVDNNESKSSNNNNIVEENITVTFETNTTQTYQPLTLKKGDTLRKPFTPQKENAKFLYWAYLKDGQLVEFTDFEKPISNDITLQAVFKEIKTYEVVLYAENVPGFPTTDTPYRVNDNEIFQLPKATPTPDKTYKFLGWYTDPEFTNLYQPKVLDSNLNLYAKIVEKELFRVTFTNPGVAGFKNIVKEVYENLKAEFDGETLQAPEGKVFKDWYVQGTTQVFSLDTPITANYILEPHFIDRTGNEESNVNKYTYELENNEYVITGIKKRSETTLYLPGIYNGKKVTKIKAGAFENNQATKIIFNENIKEIGENAFKSSNSKYVDFRNVEIIGNSAFENARSLHTIYIPNSTIKIGDKAFKDTDNSRYIILGNQLREIGEEAFAGAINTGGDIFIPKSVTTIKENAFKNASSSYSNEWGAFSSAKSHQIYVEAEAKPEGFHTNFFENADVTYNSKRVELIYNNLEKTVIVTGTKNNKLIKPNKHVPYKDGGSSKEIQGWYKDVELATEFTFSQTDKSTEDVTEGLTLYAKWTEGN